MKTRTAASIILFAAALGGCATSASNDTRGREFFADPAKYTLYNCTQLAVARGPLMERERELRAQIARAERDSVGVLVSNAAYRSDYLSIRGDLDVLEQTAARKNCAPPVSAGPRRTERISR